MKEYWIFRGGYFTQILLVTEEVFEKVYSGRTGCIKRSKFIRKSKNGEKAKVTDRKL